MIGRFAAQNFRFELISAAKILLWRAYASPAIGSSKVFIHTKPAVTASIQLYRNLQLLQLGLNKVARIDGETSGLADEQDNRDQHTKR